MGHGRMTTTQQNPEATSNKIKENKVLCLGDGGKEKMLPEMGQGE